MNILFILGLVSLPLTAHEVCNKFQENPIKANYTYTIGTPVVASGIVNGFKVESNNNNTTYIIGLSVSPECLVRAEFSSDKLDFITSLKRDGKTKIQCKLVSAEEYSLSLNNCDKFKEPVNNGQN